MLKDFRYQTQNLIADEKLIFLAGSSIFLPYIMTGIILISISIYLMVNKKSRDIILLHIQTKTSMLLLALLFVVPSIYQNWIGITAGIGIVIAVLLWIYFRSIMTQQIFEKLLAYICKFSLISVFYAVIERYILPVVTSGKYTHRISSVFFHPNYFGTVVATVIIICAYKVFTEKGTRLLYTGIALLNIISLYLCESMFAWVEVYIGIAVLLFTMKMYRLLALWFIGALVAIFVIFGLRIDVIPRLSEAALTTKLRVIIWKDAMNQIENAPLFGHGLMSYAFHSLKLGKLVMHSHNILLEMLLNFGIVGTSFFLVMVTKFYKSILKICFIEKKTQVTSLILAISTAALIHGFTDITLLWVQTFPLFLILLSGSGVYEKAFEKTELEPAYPYILINNLYHGVNIIQYRNDQNRKKLFSVRMPFKRNQFSATGKMEIP